jgi:hypothetical protein
MVVIFGGNSKNIEYFAAITTAKIAKELCMWWCAPPPRVEIHARPSRSDVDPLRATHVSWTTWFMDMIGV